MTVKLMTEHNLELLSLKEGCTGSSESTLVKMPHCWKITCHGSYIIVRQTFLKYLEVKTASNKVRF